MNAQKGSDTPYLCCLWSWVPACDQAAHSCPCPESRAADSEQRKIPWWMTWSPSIPGRGGSLPAHDTNTHLVHRQDRWQATAHLHMTKRHTWSTDKTGGSSSAHDTETHLLHRQDRWQLTCTWHRDTPGPQTRQLTAHLHMTQRHAWSTDNRWQATAHLHMTQRHTWSTEKTGDRQQLTCTWHRHTWSTGKTGDRQQLTCMQDKHRLGSQTWQVKSHLPTTQTQTWSTHKIGELSPPHYTNTDRWAITCTLHTDLVHRQNRWHLHKHRRQVIHEMGEAWLHGPRLPTRPTALPIRPTALPTRPIALPTRPTPLPTRPTALSTKPTDLPTRPTALPTRPTALPTWLIVLPIWPNVLTH